MRAGLTRQRRHEEEEESVFVSMTDMTVGFLFIVILLLAFFASQYDPSKSVPLAEHERVLSERDALTVERDQLRRRVFQLETRIRELETRIAQLNAEVDDLKIQRDALAQARDQAIAKLNELERELIRTQEELARIQLRNRELEHELERLKQPDPLETYINQSLAERRRLLERLRDMVAVDFPALKVVLTEESDALRFQGDGLFSAGSATLRTDRVDFVRGIASRLQQVLPCYTLGGLSARGQGCNGGFALIEAVQIEGHTDADGGDFTNLGLSTDRATATFRVMTEQEPNLVGHLNMKGQPVLSVAGYGEMRPVATNETLEGKASNRRIDLRLIMYVPARSEEIDRVRQALSSGIPAGSP